ncbi:Uncharacterised protein [Bordetella pertussis]|nr:Uncharacterised protein [Bordetella pertussis]
MVVLPEVICVMQSCCCEAGRFLQRIMALSW